MAVMLKGGVFPTVDLILPDSSQRKSFALASGYLRVSCFQYF